MAPYGGVLVVAMAGTHQLWGWDPATRRLGLTATLVGERNLKNVSTPIILYTLDRQESAGPG